MDKSLEIAKELAEISANVSSVLPKDVVSLIDAADYRCAWLARVGEMEADAQAILDRQRGIVASLNSDLTATALRPKLDMECADYQRLVTLSKRLYQTLTEQIEWIRTKVSFIKAERSR